MRIYAFDVDETLEISGGPIKLADVGDLVIAGNVVGICGNWAVFVRSVRNWSDFVSFVGPMLMRKSEFLTQIKTYIPAESYIMVGNIKGITGQSDDLGAAQEAGWTFLSEGEFANGAR